MSLADETSHYIRYDTLTTSMQLTLQHQKIGDIVVVRCQGRIVVGAEISSLQLELEKLTQLTKDVVLQLGEVSFIDSVGLGALVRLFGVLRAKGGDLKLCELSPFLLQVLQVTNLLGIFPIYASETEAIQAFSEGPQSLEAASGASRKRIVCTDTSNDLLAYLSALLKRSGYEIFTTRQPSDAIMFVRVTGPRVLICGPGMQTNESAMKGFREITSKTKVQLLLLPSDFSTAEAGQAGIDLVDRIRLLMSGQ
jgi:anti-sigma B factor antagonist